jgi:hypothetical protein
MMNQRAHNKSNEKNQIFFIGLTLLATATLDRYFNNQNYEEP